MQIIIVKFVMRFTTRKTSFIRGGNIFMSIRSSSTLRRMMNIARCRGETQRSECVVGQSGSLHPAEHCGHRNSKCMRGRWGQGRKNETGFGLAGHQLMVQKCQVLIFSAFSWNAKFHKLGIATYLAINLPEKRRAYKLISE